MMQGSIPFENKTPFDDFTVVQIIAGCAAILGHIWTVFAGFRGGKGIATGRGMLIGIAPVEVAVSFGVFTVVLLLSHYVSTRFPERRRRVPADDVFFRENIFLVNIEGYRTLIYFSLAISLLIIYTHRANIKRLLKGTEKPHQVLAPPRAITACCPALRARRIHAKLPFSERGPGGQRLPSSLLKTVMTCALEFSSDRPTSCGVPARTPISSLE